MDALRDNVGIDEYSGADDPAHHCHGRAEKAELTGKLWLIVRHRSLVIRTHRLTNIGYLIGSLRFAVRCAPPFREPGGWDLWDGVSG
jgi:hypothetical protein